MKKKFFFGYDFVSSHNFDEVIFEIENYSNDEKLPIVATPNIDQIIKLDKDKELQKFISNSFLILPDGQPIIWLSKIFNKKLLSRLSGSDLFPILWNRLKKTQDKILLIVPNHKVANILKQENNRAVFYITPYFDIEKQIYKDIVYDIDNIIKRDSPKYIIIGLPFHKREMLCKSLIELNNRNSLYILLGASFEFYTGIKKRAPLWMQKIGLEWFHRFLNEPKRLYKRYFIDSWYIIVVIIREFRR